TSVVFIYGLIGNTSLTYTWTGSLNFLDETKVVFPPSTSIYTNNVSATFQASVVSVNGVSDQNSFNNMYTSQTPTVAIFPSSFVLKMYTNNATDPITNRNESKYRLLDQNGNVVWKRDSLLNYTFYYDTINNLAPGCYKMIIDDSGCDGYKFWANTAVGNGNIRYEYLTGGIYWNPNGDFGCQMIKNFMVVNTTGLAKNVAIQNEIEIYPNPANGTAHIKFDLSKNQNVTYRVMDVSGKLIQQKTISNMMGGFEKVDVSKLNNGIYFVSFELENNVMMTKKLVIQN
ncbi:MAG: T9SS type A sorting domain-containing protein, partial [Bacteroidia bacterium]